MTAHGIIGALALIDVTVRSRALRYRHSCLLSEVACNPVVYHPISECLRYGLRTYLPCDTFHTSAPHSYRGLLWTLALCKPLQPVEELISVPFFLAFVMQRDYSKFHDAGWARLRYHKCKRAGRTLSVDRTLFPRVGVLLLDSPRRDSQSDGKQLTTDWSCRVALPGCRPRFALWP